MCPALSGSSRPPAFGGHGPDWLRPSNDHPSADSPTTARERGHRTCSGPPWPPTWWPSRYHRAVPDRRERGHCRRDRLRLIHGGLRHPDHLRAGSRTPRSGQRRGDHPGGSVTLPSAYVYATTPPPVQITATPVSGTSGAVALSFTAPTSDGETPVTGINTAPTAAPPGTP